MKCALYGLVVVCAACQHDVATPFPAGLEPLETDPVPDQTAPYAETLATQTSDNDYIRVYGRGYAQVTPGVMWAAAKNPQANIAVCSTNAQVVTVDDPSQYEFSFVVHYTVNNILTVEWDDQWRFGTIDGTPDDPTLGMIKHQKTAGSSFINLSEGTIQILATDDPNVTEIDFVEHLDATGSSTDDVLGGVKHNFAALVAVAHGDPIPACP